MENRVLDSALIKDLSNHIYEKRKATAFQIESFTKAALSKEDTQTIFKIIDELTELTKDGTNSAKMGAITALGSVSVGLGSLFIAFFLDQIVKPIFATFRDTDARVRYYACESLYNIAKIARGEILLYFNEVFDILCILVTDTESSVKNAADILDRLIKDIVSAKSTNYVSILQQPNNNSIDDGKIPSHIIDPNSGVAFQVNQSQDTKMAFSLPKFIPTLLERMYTLDPFAKKFLISWIELFDDIPALEIITFLPNILEPLIKFLANNAPSDVRIETQNVLNTLLKEIRGINEVKIEVKRRSLTQKQKQSSSQNAASSTQPIAEEIDLIKNGSENPDNQLQIGSVTDANQILDDPSTDIDNLSIKSNSTVLVNGKKMFDSVDSEEEVFLNGQDIFIDYAKIIDILLSFIRFPLKNKPGEKVNDTRGEIHEIFLEIQFTVLQWLKEILNINPTSFIKYFPDCVAIILKNIELSDLSKDYELRNEFLRFNSDLQEFLIDLNEAAKAKPHHEDNDKKNSEEISLTERDNSESQTGSDVIANTMANSKSNIDISTGTGDQEFELSDIALKGINYELYEEFIEFQLSKTLQTIMNECLTSSDELSRITGLDWLIFLYSTNPSNFFEEVGGSKDKKKIDLTALLRSSTDSSNDVILKVLQLMCKISETNHNFFKSFMIELITFFEKEIESSNHANSAVNTTTSATANLSRGKIEFIIRKLCLTLDSEKIFKTISEVLISMKNLNLDFLNMITVTLNNILLTTRELTSFRKKLKNLDIYKSDDWNLFATLFESWCHNPPSAISLCLLTSNYELSFSIIRELSELEISFQLLTQLDVLVQFLESPIFVKLRMQLLEPDKNPFLYKTLYGLLMILPQSSTFTSLKNRLSSVSTNLSTGNFAPSGSSSSGVTGTVPVSNTGSNVSIKRKRVNEMLDKFTKIQEEHEFYHQNLYQARTNVSTFDDKSSKDPSKFRDPKNRLISYDGSLQEKRKPSGRFVLSRFGQ